MNDCLAIDPACLDTLLASNGSMPGGIRSEIEQNVEVISIRGAMSYRPRGFSWLFTGETATYESVRGHFQFAIEDDAVTAIVFDIDSAGGEVAGLFDLVDEIYSARGKKPIYAIANESALSAAYAIASAADKVFVSRTAKIGSIGVLALHIDQSEADRKAGLKYTAITAGKHKADFSSHAPLAKEAFEAAQSAVNTSFDLFCSTVARNRGIPEKAVRDTQAAIFTGQDAVDIGLADGEQSINQLLETILTQGGDMTLKTDLRALLAGKKPEEIAEAMASFNYVPKQTERAENKPAQEGADVPQSGQAEQILGLCELAGVKDLTFVSGLIKEGVTVEQARTKILEAKANASEQNQIFSTVSALTTGEVNPLLADAKRRAGK